MGEIAGGARWLGELAHITEEAGWDGILSDAALAPPSLDGRA